MSQPIYDKAAIEQIIPHRAPFLWLDEVTEISDTHIVARKFIGEDLEIFQGHYPQFPVLPGVIQCEMALQASAILIARLITISDDQVPVAARMNNVQFRKMVRPGDMVDIHVSIDQCMGGTYYLVGKVMVEGKVTTRLEFATTAAKLPTSTAVS
jgi:3-hydroxyacyl-[acyl-carrier-protein] dehydratase